MRIFLFQNGALWIWYWCIAGLVQQVYWSKYLPHMSSINIILGDVYGQPLTKIRWWTHFLEWWERLGTRLLVISYELLLNLWLSRTLVSNKLFITQCSWSTACRCYSEYIFIPDVTPGFNGLGTDNYKTWRNTSTLWDSVRLKLRGWRRFMMTSSNGSIFRVTGPLCGEFTGPGEFPAQRPVTRSFDVFFDLHLNKRLSKQPWGWWFETPAWSLWRHRNVEYIYVLS